jgi:S-DNA-T family DNA segregation ATPase FtsK/SpoIIIE
MKFFARKSASKSQPKAQPKKGGGAPPPAPAPRVKTVNVDLWLDIVGYGLIGLAVLTLFAALSPNNGSLTGTWLDLLKQLFGWGMFLAPLIVGLIGVYLVVRRFGDRFPSLAPSRLFGAVLAFLAALVTMQIIAMFLYDANGQTVANAGQGGGRVGWFFLSLMNGLVGDVGAFILLIVWWAVAVMLIVNVSIPQLVLNIQRSLNRQPTRPTDDIIEPKYDQGERRGDDGLIIRGLRPRKPAPKRSAIEEEQPTPVEDVPPARTITGPVSANPANATRSETIGVPVAPSNSNAAPPRPPVIDTPKSRTSEGNRVPPPRIIGANSVASGAPSQPGSTAQPMIQSRLDVQREWVLPKVEDVLEPGSDAALKEADIRARVAIIEDTLRAFGVPSRVTEVNRGPTITQFGVEPGFIDMRGGKQVKVKVSRIAALADDLALALSAPRIRIEAPVPGRNVVGIEVPNGETSLVSLRDVMESDEFEALKHKTQLRLAFGQDVSGRPVVADLTSMPHLLIAGTTGSGKSVCVNSIIATMLCLNTPEDLRFVMIDPKRVELTGYNDIPHLIGSVIVDVEKTTGVLQWMSREMDNRYRLFAKYGVRNIGDFNAKVASQTTDPSPFVPRQARDAQGGSGQARRQTTDSSSSVAHRPSSDPELRKLPYILLVIDELADLMMMAPDETEKTICRLAQMARATGIHLILATQRPSVDVVTGLIKANFPARIAFTVATSVDSRVILDGPGAEKLLGRGDMLVVTPEQAMPLRAQGCFLGPSEIDRVVDYWRRQNAGLAGMGKDPIAAAMTAPSIPMRGTLDSEQVAAIGPSQPDDVFAGPPITLPGGAPTWDEARALSEAVGEAGGARDDKLFHDAVLTVRMNGKASISLLQRRLRIGYTRAARLIEEMEEKGIVGPPVPGQQHREVLNSPLNDEL